MPRRATLSWNSAGVAGSGFDIARVAGFEDAAVQCGWGTRAVRKQTCLARVLPSSVSRSAQVEHVAGRRAYVSRVGTQKSAMRLRAIASKTGCTSEGELAMTLRISAVAVCRSSASLVSLNRRTFSIAITA
jgi:hypothetical protein